MKKRVQKQNIPRPVSENIIFPGLEENMIIPVSENEPPGRHKKTKDVISYGIPL